jgi:PadR family transcriptional regulator PadR
MPAMTALASARLVRDQDDYFDNWTVQVRKGLLEVCILNALAQREFYGYDLVKSLTRMLGWSITEGTIYPLLSRLRVQKLVSTRLEESSEGPARKYYALTAKGRATARLMNDYLAVLLDNNDRSTPAGA